MYIRHVGVLVFQFLMGMPVGVFLRTAFVVGMSVMPVVMAVPVFMGQPFMPVPMAMVFPEDQSRSNQHQRQRNEKCDWWKLLKQA